jgi:hypothetical protein
MKEVAENIDHFEVASVDASGNIFYEKPSFGQQTGHKRVYVVLLDTGLSIRATPDHAFVSGGKWITLQEIIYGGRSFDLAGVSRRATIVGIREETEDVYDIEMPTHHSFVLESGAIAHNCAHSTSYAIVAYNGAWLKHHYPVDFWKGELTVRHGNQEKLRDYLNEAADLILGTSVLRSHPTDWTIEEVSGTLKLRPPIMSIKGCGQKSVENLRAFLAAETPGQLNVHDMDADAEEAIPEEAESDME